MSLLVGLLAGGTAGSLITAARYRARTLAADHWHYERVRADTTPVRQIVEELDHWRRLCTRLERENARLRAVATAWQARVGRLLTRRGQPADPCPFPRFRPFRWLP